tara:strand:+ start:1629 stop:1886 length:258 start_codon:yes stop_codon:yes gene_type:complete
MDNFKHVNKVFEFESFILDDLIDHRLGLMKKMISAYAQQVEVYRMEIFERIFYIDHLIFEKMEIPVEKRYKYQYYLDMLGSKHGK